MNLILTRKKMEEALTYRIKVAHHSNYSVCSQNTGWTYIEQRTVSFLITLRSLVY